jgi:hypothetical protein
MIEALCGAPTINPTPLCQLASYGPPPVDRGPGRKAAYLPRISRIRSPVKYRSEPCVYYFSAYVV